jgi:glyoxylase-like metal-dependent hydrolase (beta-lactamase superfamily II)
MKSTAESPPAAAVTAEGEAFPSAPKRLHYVEYEPPAPGKSVPIADGVRWARIPLPMDLNHINVWLLDVADGTVVVDTGMAAAMGKEAWESIERDLFAAHPLQAVFVTHIHPDHIGLAAWLQERHSVPVLMSRRTHEFARAMISGAGHFAAAESFFRRHGLSDPAQILPMFKPERFVRMTSGVPDVRRYVADEEIVDWGAGQRWRALETNGHAEGHLCLSSLSQPVLISGDQVLPTISSNISFNFRNVDVNPLGSYLSSLRRLRRLPAETLVLPSHGIPFRGLHQRADDLLEHHEEQLAMLVEACEQPKTATDLLPRLFRRELKGMHLFLALGEALAHLEYLVHEGRVDRVDDAGVTRYLSRAA